MHMKQNFLPAYSMKNGISFVVIALLAAKWFNLDFDLCKWDELWCHDVDAKWCKVTKNWISVQILSLQGWCAAITTHWCQWLRCHCSNILVARPLPSLNEKCLICCSRTDFHMLVLCNVQIHLHPLNEQRANNTWRRKPLILPFEWTGPGAHCVATEMSQ